MNTSTIVDLVSPARRTGFALLIIGIVLEAGRRLAGQEDSSLGTLAALVVGLGAGTFITARALAFLLRARLALRLGDIQASADIARSGTWVEPFLARANDSTEVIGLGQSVNQLARELTMRIMALVTERNHKGLAVERLHHLESYRRDFVSNVAHELRTPLTAIQGAIETLESDEISPDEARVFFKIIHRQTHRLGDFASGLLKLAQLDEYRPDDAANFKESSLGDIIRHARETSATRAQARGVDLVTELALAVYLRVNPGLIEQALINLIDNAVDNSPSGSRVVIRLRRESDGGAILEVEDRGPGIAPEHHERIFERFYRVDAARNRRQGGTGLGLSIVKHIAILHRGEVGVKSKPGEGALFWIRLYAVASAEDEAADNVAATPSQTP